MMGAGVIVRNAEFGPVPGFVGVDPPLVFPWLSAMRSCAGAVFVNVDGPPVFGGCLPRWEIAGVNFYETASHVVRG